MGDEESCFLHSAREPEGAKRFSIPGISTFPNPRETSGNGKVETAVFQEKQRFVVAPPDDQVETATVLDDEWDRLVQEEAS